MRRYSVLLSCFLFFTSSTTSAQTSSEKREPVKLGVARFAKGYIDGAISYSDKAIHEALRSLKY